MWIGLLYWCCCIYLAKSVLQYVCMYMWNMWRCYIQSFIKIYYNRPYYLCRFIERHRENLNILERVINGTKVFSLFIFHVYLLDMRVIYNCGSKLSDTCYASKSCLLLIVSLFRTSGTRRKRKEPSFFDNSKRYSYLFTVSFNRLFNLLSLDPVYVLRSNKNIPA